MPFLLSGRKGHTTEDARDVTEIFRDLIPEIAAIRGNARCCVCLDQAGRFNRERALIREAG